MSTWVRGLPANCGGGAQMSSGMRSARVSMLAMVAAGIAGPWPVSLGRRDGNLDRRVVRRQIRDVLVAEHLGNDRHHLVAAGAAAIFVERLDEVALRLAGEMRGLRQLREPVEPVAGLALRGLAAAGGGVTRRGRRERNEWQDCEHDQQPGTVATRHSAIPIEGKGRAP